MPNHIRNIIRWNGRDEDIRQLLKSYDQKNKDFCALDFNKLIPQPSALDVDKKSHLTDEELEIRKSNKEKYGFEDWYEWRIYHWGTKWNAYNQQPIERGVEFDTAWSHPTPVIYKLSKLFPYVTFEVAYADEDIGHNCGFYVARNGNRINIPPADYFAMEVRSVIHEYLEEYEDDLRTLDDDYGKIENDFGLVKPVALGGLSHATSHN